MMKSFPRFDIVPAAQKAKICSVQKFVAVV